MPAKAHFQVSLAHALECPPGPMLEKPNKAFCTATLHLPKMLARRLFLALDQVFIAIQGMAFPAVFLILVRDFATFRGTE